MKICLNCKKIFEDDVDVCPDCGSALNQVKHKKKKAKAKKNPLVYVGWGCLGCLSIFGILFFILMLIGLIVSSNGISHSKYKYHGRVSLSSKLMVQNHLMSAKSRTRRVAMSTNLNNFSTPEELVENAFLPRTDLRFTKTTLPFTNVDVCDGVTFFDSIDNMYCITNWSNENCDESNNMPCSSDQHQPNLYVDINGQEGPNQLTEDTNQINDIFSYYIYNSTVRPSNITKKVM